MVNLDAFVHLDIGANLSWFVAAIHNAAEIYEANEDAMESVKGKDKGLMLF